MGNATIPHAAICAAFKTPQMTRFAATIAAARLAPSASLVEFDWLMADAADAALLAPPVARSDSAGHSRVGSMVDLTALDGAALQASRGAFRAPCTVLPLS